MDAPMQALVRPQNKTLGRRDGWENQKTGHGTTRDRRTLTRYSADVVTDLEALVLWRTEFLAARIIEAWVDAAYRRGWSIKTDDEGLGKKMRSWADDLGVEAAVTKAACYEAAYGGAAIFPVLEGALGDISQPLNLETGSIQTIKALHVLEPRELQPEEWYGDLTDVGWQRPKLWRLQPLQGGRSGWAGMQHVHSSRLILWPGIQVSRQTQPGQREGWGDSVLCRPKGVIADFGLAWGSAATLLHQHGRSTLKKDGLAKMLALADGLEEWDKHISAMQMAWSTLRMNAIDAKDDVVQSNGSLTGVSDTLNEFKSLMSAATEGIPLSVLFGESQTGLQSGDADNEGWDAKVEGRRNKRYRPPHEKILKLMFLSQDGPSGGEEPEVWSLEYPPLSAPTEKELSEIRKSNVDKAEVLVGNGIASADDIAESYYGTSPDGDVKGDVHIDWDRRAKQAEAAAQAQSGQMNDEDMAAMGYEPDDAELDGMAAQDATVGSEWEDPDPIPTDEELDDLEAQDDEEGADLEWDDEEEDDERTDEFEQRTDKGAYKGSSGGKGYNPNRASDGKFGSGPHKASPKVGHEAGTAVAESGPKGTAKPKATRTPRPKFDDSAHKAKIAEHKTSEAHHRKESLRVAGEMRALKEQAKALPRGKAGAAQRAELKAQHAELAKQRDGHRANATEARGSRVATAKEAQAGRKEYLAKTKEARLAETAAKAKPMTEADYDKAKGRFDGKAAKHEKDAALEYSSSKYTEINGVLRGKLGDDQLSMMSTKELNTVIKDLDGGMSKARLTKPAVTYRGMQHTSETSKMKPGDIFLDHGYMSTTMNREVAESFSAGSVMLSITWPKGSKLAAIPSHFDVEKEMLGGRGTALRLDRVEKAKDKHGAEYDVWHMVAVGQK